VVTRKRCGDFVKYHFDNVEKRWLLMTTLFRHKSQNNKKIIKTRLNDDDDDDEQKVQILQNKMQC